MSINFLFCDIYNHISDIFRVYVNMGPSLTDTGIRELSKVFSLCVQPSLAKSEHAEKWS